MPAGAGAGVFPGKARPGAGPRRHLHHLFRRAGCLLSEDRSGPCGGRPAHLGPLLPLSGGDEPHLGGGPGVPSFLPHPGQPGQPSPGRHSGRHLCHREYGDRRPQNHGAAGLSLPDRPAQHAGLCGEAGHSGHLPPAGELWPAHGKHHGCPAPPGGGFSGGGTGLSRTPVPGGAGGGPAAPLEPRTDPFDPAADPR